MLADFYDMFVMDVISNEHELAKLFLCSYAMLKHRPGEIQLWVHKQFLLSVFQLP